jgi:hypothetical protein
MYTKEQVETMIREVQIEKKLRSPRQVFEIRPDLGSAYLDVWYASQKTNQEEICPKKRLKDLS